MKNGLALFAYLVFVSFIQAQTVFITGEITDAFDQGIEGCTVALSDSTHISTTGDIRGRFTLEGEFPVSVEAAPGVPFMTIRGTDLLLQVNENSARVKISLHDISGALLSKVLEQTLPAGDHALSLPEPCNVITRGVVLLRIHINGTGHTFKWNQSGQVVVMSRAAGLPIRKQSAAAGEDQTAEIHCDGYEDRQVSLDSYTVDLGAIMMQRIPGDPIEHIGTTQIWDGNGQNINIDVPSGTEAGDLLVLVLHRTDDDLPLFVDGWTRMAECYKTNNGNECQTEQDCEAWHNDDFCQTFSDGPGHDLAQAVFYKEAASDEPGSYRFDLNRDSDGHPGWIILTTLRNAATTDPVRDWDGVGCDGSADSKFPSVYGEEGDMLVLSQSFDDFEGEDVFRAPSGMEYWGYVGNSDETGYLYGGLLTSTGETGVRTTTGPGAANCKDALVSLTIKPR